MKNTKIYCFQRLPKIPFIIHPRRVGGCFSLSLYSPPLTPLTNKLNENNSSNYGSNKNTPFMFQIQLVTMTFQEHHGSEGLKVSMGHTGVTVADRLPLPFLIDFQAKIKYLRASCESNVKELANNADRRLKRARQTKLNTSK